MNGLLGMNEADRREKTILKGESKARCGMNIVFVGGS